ncbi:MAG: CDP-glycerol glycerophosphotransferase family protein [Lachnospiraceae bacterium]|nr:CDP-glycerol glycerophosphotransferase family protein [Lachnospiraceae bacterium]
MIFEEYYCEGVCMSTILILSEKPILLNKVKGDIILLATKSSYLFSNISDERVKILSLEHETITPSEKTWKLLDEINNLIKKIIGRERSWVYEAGYHIEGSGLAQNCSDILSGVEIIEQFFEQYDINKVILYPTAENLIECMLLEEELSHRKNIKLQRHYEGIKNYLFNHNYGIVYLLKCVYAYLNIKKRFWKLWKKAKRDVDKKQENYQLGMLHASNSKKSISWKSSILYGLKEELKTYKLLCLNAREAEEYFKKNGIATDNMEEWLTKETVYKKTREYGKFVKKLLRAKKKDFKSCYINMNITQTVRYFIIMHFLWNVPRNIEIDSICYDYFKKNYYAVINSHGDSNFIETRATYMNTRNADTRLFRQEGLMIFNVPRYESYCNMISIRFFCNDSKRYEELMRQGWKGNAYFIGDIQYIPKFMEQYNGCQKIEKAFKEISVLWAPSYVVRGYTTYNTFQENNEKILSCFNENGWKLYVKFHPNQQENQVKKYKKQYENSKNIQFVNKDDSIYEWIEKADIIITDKSLLVFDGITAGKPVMVLCGPLHYSLMSIHEKGVQIYQRIEEMMEELKSIENDWDFFLQWRKETIKRQDNYFKSFIKESDAIKDMANALKIEQDISFRM